MIGTVNAVMELPKFYQIYLPVNRVIFVVCLFNFSNYCFSLFIIVLTP